MSTDDNPTPGHDDNTIIPFRRRDLTRRRRRGQRPITPNFTDERFEQINRCLTDQHVLTNPALPDAARLVYVIGGLIATDDGVIGEAALQQAMHDREVLQIALGVISLHPDGGPALVAACLQDMTRGGAR